MKRSIAFLVLAALLSQAAFSQDASQPSEQSVLQKARDKFWSRTAKTPRGDAVQDVEAPTRDEESAQAAGKDEEAPFTPIIFSFVPGISVPFGIWNTSMSLGCIGNLTNDVYGFQGAGVFNLANDIRGFQGAGVFNLVRNVEGFQGAGVFNIASGRVSGFQGAGVFNIVEGLTSGVQSAGVFNITGETQAPIQYAGVFNIAKNLDGLQVAGVFNIAHDVKGGQFASVVNVANDVRGVQVGLVNVAEEIHGLQLGLVNISRNGVNSVGATWQGETEYVYGYLQAGSPEIYTLVGAGAPKGDWFVNGARFVGSFGLGSRMSLGHSYIEIDVSAESLVGDTSSLHSTHTSRDDAIRYLRDVIPYPAIRLLAGIPIGRRLHLIGGWKIDVDLTEYPRVPAELKKGGSYSDTWAGVPFTAWSKWFVGFKI